MECKNIYKPRFSEIRLLASMAQSNSLPGGNVQAINALTRSGLVLLCGYFEGFVREMSKEFVEELNDLNLTPTKVPVKILSEHVNGCSEKFKQNKHGPFISFIESVESASPITFDSDKLSSTNANPTVDTIERIFNIFGMPFILDELSLNDFPVTEMYSLDTQVDKNLKKNLSVLVTGSTIKEDDIIRIIESKWSPKKKRRRVGYLNTIDELLKKRNRIAHGEGFDPVTPDELMKATDEVEMLCDSLVLRLNEKLSQLSS